jgi:hypothetical protein
MVVRDLTSSYPSENDHHQGLGPTGGSVMEDVVLGYVVSKSVMLES